MKSISNLVNCFHFKKIYNIQRAKDELENNGLIALDKAKKINRYIFNFIKKFGINYYEINGTMQ